MSATTGAALLGRYRLENLIGRGGMAEVHRALDTTLDRVVAVKVIQHPHAADETFLERFRREAKLVAALDHPHVLPVWDYGEDDGRPFLVMPFVDGGTLEDRIRSGRMEMDDVRRVVAEVGAALDAAHAAGILHRDIKPANVLLDRDGRAVLADFGIARSAGKATTLTAAGMVIGTPTYMAPELAQGTSASRASDIYALAAMTWEMIAGRPPFEGENPLSVLHQHVTQPVPTLMHAAGGLAPALDHFFRVAMAKRPDERPTSGADFAARFEAASSGIHARVTQPVSGPATEKTLSLGGSAPVAVTGSGAVPGTTHPGTGSARAPRPGPAGDDAHLGISPLAVVAGGVLALMLASALFAMLGGPDEPEGRDAEPVATRSETGASPAGGSNAAAGGAPVGRPATAAPATRERPAAAAPATGNEARRELPPSDAVVPQPRRFTIPPLKGDIPRELAERIARPERMTAAEWAAIARSAEARMPADSGGWAALIATWAAGAAAFEKGDDETAAAALDAIRAAVSARAAAAPGVLGLIATNGAAHETWEMALAFGDPRADGLAAVDRVLAIDGDDPRALLGRSLLLHMHDDHRGAARDAGRAHDVAAPAGHAAAADLALLAAAEYEESSLAVEAAGWYERAAAYGGRASERAVVRGVPLIVRELRDRDRAIGLLRTACAAGVTAACDRLQDTPGADRATDQRALPRSDTRRRRRR